MTEREACNGGDPTRGILLSAIRRSKTVENECGLASAMFEAIDARSGENPAGKA